MGEQRLIFPTLGPLVRFGVSFPGLFQGRPLQTVRMRGACGEQLTRDITLEICTTGSFGADHYYPMVYFDVEAPGILPNTT